MHYEATHAHGILGNESYRFYGHEHLVELKERLLLMNLHRAIHLKPCNRHRRIFLQREEL